MLFRSDYCKKYNLPWIYSGAIGRIGAVYVNKTNGPCYQCFNQEKSGNTCATAGVLNSTVALIGSLAASIAVDYLALDKVEEDLLRIDLVNNTLTRLKVNKNPECNACNGKYVYLETEEEKEIKIIKICARDRWQVDLGKNIDIAQLEEKIPELEIADDGEYLISKNMTVFSNGRIIVRGKDEEDVKEKIEKIL